MTTVISDTVNCCDIRYSWLLYLIWWIDMMSDTVDCCDIRSITAKISDTVHCCDIRIITAKISNTEHPCDNRYSGICFIRYSWLFDFISDMIRLRPEWVYTEPELEFWHTNSGWYYRNGIFKITSNSCQTITGIFISWSGSGLPELELYRIPIPVGITGTGIFRITSGSG